MSDHWGAGHRRWGWRVVTGNGSSAAPRDRATLEEVAELAGVSRATVSRVINGKPRVSHETRVAVERAAARLGYVPNRAARSLVTRRNDSIGLVIPEPTAQIHECRPQGASNPALFAGDACRNGCR